MAVVPKPKKEKILPQDRLSPFDFTNSINDTKQNLMGDCEIAEKKYSSFMVNRGLSYFPDTVFMANEMNRYHHLDGKLQYSFLINIVRKRKRFSKWNKATNINYIDAIKTYFGYNNTKALQVLTLLTNEQLAEIHNKVNKGGRK
jgi:hypothetical protein